jgi:hypothetical protein
MQTLAQAPIGMTPRGEQQVGKLLMLIANAGSARAATCNNFTPDTDTIQPSTGLEDDDRRSR